LALWVLKTGVLPDEERQWLRDSSIAVGWRELPDLSKCQDREALSAAYRRAYPEVRGAKLVREVSELYAFAHEMRRGDLVALPLSVDFPVAVGEIAGDYAHGDTSSAHPHRRAVRWLAIDVPRSAWDSELALALDSPMTLHRVRRRSAEEKLRSIVAGRAVERGGKSAPAESLEERARREILERICERFPGDALADLVQVIFAVRGALVADRDPTPTARETLLAVSSEAKTTPPRLYVEIVRSRRAADGDVVARFAAALAARDVDHGLLVALGGFTADARRAAFDLSRVTLWNGADLIDATVSNYERLPVRFQEAIPLKRIWIVAPAEASSR